jgi:hypothetical protein
MEEILSNLIAASLKKVEEDVENEGELVNLLENLANIIKDSNPKEVIRRILSIDVLRALDSFEIS